MCIRDRNIEDSLAILDEESDEEMRELAKEELKDSKPGAPVFNRIVYLKSSFKLPKK